MQHRHLRRRSQLLSLAALTLSTYGFAAPTLYTSVDQKGDFVLFGNTLGWDCGAAATTFPTGTTANCNGATNTNDSAIDIYWRSEDNNTASASTSTSMENARSTAELVLPTGATITHARLYWAAMVPSGSADNSVVIDRPGNSNSLAVTADKCWTSFVEGTSGKFYYQCAANIETWLTALGPGAFRVSGVTAVSSLHTYSDDNTMAGWFVVVFYKLGTDRPRNLTIFEGLDSVYQNHPQTAVISGFLVPAAFDAKVAVVGYEGDDEFDGDSFSMGANSSTLTNLTNAVNPANNVFNSTRSYLGAGVSNSLDRPQLPGTADTMGGIDMDVFEVKSPILQPNQTSATIEASSTFERLALGAIVTSISTFKPDFSSSGKTVADVNGGGLVPGDILEYTVTVKNTGSDASKNTVMTDVLPTQVTYVPNSLALVTPTAAALTDTAGDDTGEYVSGTRTIAVRLGTGANATTGGTMAVNDTITLKFRVTLNANAAGTIDNQAVITASGVQGAPSTDYPTDGNGDAIGVPPTTIGVDRDGDGIDDATEVTYGTNPTDADSDDDGVLDGAEPSPNTDSDGDGLINALDPDSDNDGLFDGTELGLGCSNAATDLKATRCVADADAGATKTNPLLADTDGGGMRDGSEDINLNGRIDAGETDPTTGHGADDATVQDSDGDGLSNGLEATLGSNPNDKDTDDDGVLDGLEPNPSDDGDRDGLVDVRDSDSDDDGLFDGTEMSLGCADPATNAAAHQCIADTDPATHTSAVNPDTDSGGVRDGSEDINRNGAVDVTETNPVAGQGADDTNAVNLDTDGDHLPDRLETAIGSNPNDMDTDDDGLPDGEEANPTADTDGDGLINILDPDSDGDGLFDGTELGYGCNGTGTAANNPVTCIADADSGATWTSPLDPDTDRGGVKDGTEDINKNGVVDANERNPNLATDDAWGCVIDSNCDPSPTSGRVCNDSHACVDGCRGVEGNTCPAGRTCSSTTKAIGTCSAPSGAAGAAGAAGTAGAAGSTVVIALGGANATTAGAAGLPINVASGGRLVAAGAAGRSNDAAGGAVAGGTAIAVAGGGMVNAGQAGIAGATAGNMGVAGAGAPPLANGGSTMASGGTAPALGGGVNALGGARNGTSSVPSSTGGDITIGDSLEGGGCDCRVAHSNSNSSWILGVMAAGLMWLRRRRST